MNEQDFLKNFAKILKVEDRFEEMEQQRIKEQKLLEKFGAALGVEVVEEERRVPDILIARADVIQQIAERLPDPEPVVESVIPPNPVLPVKDIVTKSVEKIAAASPKDVQKVIDSIPPSLRKELDIIKYTSLLSQTSLIHRRLLMLACSGEKYTKKGHLCSDSNNSLTKQHIKERKFLSISLWQGM